LAASLEFVLTILETTLETAASVRDSIEGVATATLGVARSVAAA
jgi:hypothetical protein